MRFTACVLTVFFVGILFVGSSWAVATGSKAAPAAPAKSASVLTGPIWSAVAGWVGAGLLPVFSGNQVVSAALISLQVSISSERVGPPVPPPADDTDGDQEEN